MNIWMSGLDHNLAPISLRETLSFSREEVAALSQKILRQDGVLGVVILSTCNRTEIYLSCADHLSPDPGKLLCKAAGVAFAPYAYAFVCRKGEDCLKHLLNVSCGLESRILGEDQILSQVKNAAALARQAHTIDAPLEVLFRTAAACGKATKGMGHLTAVAASAPQQALDAARKTLGGLRGTRILIVGNGEMGRLAARLFRDAGCTVTVTLRTYRHGETLVPAGCHVVPYEARYDALEQADILLSATTSPHYTVTLESFCALSVSPSLLIDLAIPRDIQPEIADLPGVTLLNVDDLESADGADLEILHQIECLMAQYAEKFRRWAIYRDSLHAQEQLQNAVLNRMHAYKAQGDSMEEMVKKLTTLLCGSLPAPLTAQELQACAEKIQIHTRGEVPYEPVSSVH